MFDNFYKYFNTSNNTSSNSIEEFIGNNAGKSFGNGLYHIFNKEDSEKCIKEMNNFGVGVKSLMKNYFDLKIPHRIHYIILVFFLDLFYCFLFYRSIHNTYQTLILS